MENITHALEMMGQGMLGIFVVLGAIALLVALMQRIDHRGKKKKQRFSATEAWDMLNCVSVTASPAPHPPAP